MHPYALRVVVGLGTVGVACLAIVVAEYIAIDVERFAEHARIAGAVGLLLLVILAVARAIEWPQSVRVRASLLTGWVRKVGSRLRWSMLPRAIAIGLLLAAPAFYARDYFILLRWVVAGCAALTAAIAWRRQQPAWLWLAAMVTVLFNPVAEIHLSRSTWAVIDPIVALWFAASLFAVRE